MRLLFFSVLLFISIVSRPQETFVTRKLKDIYQQLGRITSFPEANKSETFQTTLKGKSVSCILLRDNHSRISHLGIKLFDRVDSLPYPSEILLFLERIMLESALMERTVNLQQKLKEDGIVFYYNDAELGSFTFSEFTPALELFSHAFDFSMHTDSLVVAGIFKGQHGNSFKLLFPARNTLIMGMDKKELDQALLEALTEYRKRSPEVLFPANKNPSTISLFVNTSVFKEFFPGISTRRYYESKEADDRIPIFNREHPKESLANLFLEEIPDEMNRQVAITHVVYGMEKKEYIVNLNDLKTFFRDSYEWYFGTENLQPRILSGTVIIFNAGRHFIHLLSVSVPEESLLNPAVPIQAILYSNIPTDNIKNLFAEYSAKERHIRTKLK